MGVLEVVMDEFFELEVEDGSKGIKGLLEDFEINCLKRGLKLI